MKTLLTLITTALLISAAQARIGETPEECNARYGAGAHAFTDGQAHMVWQKGEVIISAYFIAEKCERIQFEKSRKGPALTEADATLLIEANSSGMKWRECFELIGKEWERTDKATALFVGGKLDIKTTAWMAKEEADIQAKIAAQKAEAEAAAKAKLKGF
jgi:hypothetical protein